MQWSRVDLPDPLGPMTATTSPRARLKSTPRRASVWPKRLIKPEATSTSGTVGTAAGAGGVGSIVTTESGEAVMTSP